MRCPSPYWDWGPRTAPEVYYQLFCGTAPTHHLYGLRAALDMILEEGLEAVWARHAVFARDDLGGGRRLGRRRRAGAQHRATRGSRSHAVTTIRTAPGDGARLRALVRRHCRADARHRAERPRGVDPDSVFRIGHMGHLNPPMLLGTLATIEAGLGGARHSHTGRAAPEAAAAVIAAGRRKRADGRKRLEIGAGIG